MQTENIFLEIDLYYILYNTLKMFANYTIQFVQWAKFGRETIACNSRPSVNTLRSYQICKVVQTFGPSLKVHKLPRT